MASSISANKRTNGEMMRIEIFSCPIFSRAPDVALLLRVARLGQHDFWMKRTRDSVSLSIGSDGSERNRLISEMSKSVQNSSVEACIPAAPCGEKKMNQEEIECIASSADRVIRDLSRPVRPSQRGYS